jgi:hypothetical protein
MIRIDQAANPLPVGVPGRARRDLLLSSPVTLRNADPTGVRRYQWTLLSKPPDSTATVVNPTSAVATITPDKHGWYRVQLSINSGQASLEEVQVRCFAVPDTADQARPAAGSKGAELNYDVSGSPNALGWAREMNEGHLWSIDSRHAPVTWEVNGGASQDFAITWGKPDALLQMLSVDSNGTSTMTRVSFYRDAARTESILALGPFDPSGPPFLYNLVTMLTGATDTLENNTVYGTLFNDDAANGTYSVAWRLRSV